MSTFKSSATHFILVASMFVSLSFASPAAPKYMSHACTDSSVYQPGSIFEVKLDDLLHTLELSIAVAAAQGLPHDGFYHASMDWGAPNKIKGQFLCRGDVTAKVCLSCVAVAAEQIRRRCTNQTEAIIWYDVCLLRYSNDSYLNNIVPSVGLQDDKNVSGSDLDQFSDLLATTLLAVTEQAANSSSSGKKFATKEALFRGSQKIYTLAQCTPQLSRFDCNTCLQSSISSIPICCNGKQGARVLLPSCNVRYEFYPFYSVSALPTQPASPPASSEKRKGRSKMILLIAVPTCVSVLLLCAGYYSLRKKARESRKTILIDNFGHEITTLEPLQLELTVIKAATNNFSHEHRIGRGGFGEVYKGILLDGRQIAVKRLSQCSKQGANEFKNEVLLIAKLQHRNLVVFVGFCLEEQEKILVYEYVINKSLDYFLFDIERKKMLSWFHRYNIIEGIARGILYLHEYSRLKVIHCDLKPNNILLDENMIPKISDFGLARIVEINQDQGSTNRIVGTYGYMSPEYVMFGRFSEKSDVFSFGVMMLEIITGERNASSYDRVDDSLLSYVWKRWRDQTSLSILDPTIKENYSTMEVIKCIQIGLSCVQQNPDARPTMAAIVSHLSNHSIELPTPQEPVFFLHERMDPTAVEQESNFGRCINTFPPSSMNEMSISDFLPR